MFHLSTVGFSRSVDSLLEVLELFQNNGHFAFLDASEVSLSHAGQPLHVTKYDGRLDHSCIRRDARPLPLDAR